MEEEDEADGMPAEARMASRIALDCVFSLRVDKSVLAPGALTPAEAMIGSGAGVAGAWVAEVEVTMSAGIRSGCQLRP